MNAVDWQAFAIGVLAGGGGVLFVLGLAVWGVGEGESNGEYE